MRKLILALFLLITVNVFGQFSLTESGFKTASGEDFIIIQDSGKTAHEIFNAELSKIKAIYSNNNSPETIIQTVDDSNITIEAIEKLTLLKSYGIGYYYNTKYKIAINVRNGKYKISAPIIATMACSGQTPQKLLLWISEKYKLFYGTSIFENGKLKIDEAKKNLDEYFNSIITKITDKTKNNTIGNDW